MSRYNPDPEPTIMRIDRILWSVISDRVRSIAVIVAVPPLALLIGFSLIPVDASPVFYCCIVMVSACVSIGIVGTLLESLRRWTAWRGWVGRNCILPAARARWRAR